MKVGEYVRTKSGFIDKIININDFREPSVKYALEQPSWNDDIVFVGEEDIIKSSPNIIDLIEVGDILYLKESDDIACMFFKDIYLVKNEDNLLNIIGDIKNKKCNLISIVTKEQFEAMEYKCE